MARKLSGKKIVATINGTVVPVKMQSYKEAISKTDTTDSGSGDSTEHVVNHTTATGKIEGFWDAEANLHDSPINVRAGTGNTLKLNLETASSPFFNCANTTFENVEVKMDAKGSIEFSFDFESNGPYSMPTGNF